ncbi:ATP-binding protein, partial [Vitreimonas sp.]|uniref:ATP-binding protein n=1 Tax=Vitreimonas sp. TaxID=3069702 RepID=UPI002EDA4E40
MASLKPNLVKRVERLPKPTDVADAMQPLFEAISNAIHSTQAKFGENVARLGRVHVEVSINRRKENVWAVVEDNGVGLDAANWEAFTTTDTDNKIDIGGKGVGRLLWLDCFSQIEVASVFAEDDTRKERTFKFALSMENQITDHKLENAPASKPTGFRARFNGLKNNGYLAKFPGRKEYVFQHITSHFLPTFIGGRCP